MDQNGPHFQDPAAALRAALAATQQIPHTDEPNPDMDLPEQPEPQEVPDLPTLTEAAGDATVRFDAHGFPHRDGVPVAWNDLH